MTTSNIYSRIMQARLDLQALDLKKTGNNKFAGYKYFELGDFLPQTQGIFARHGLLGIVSYGKDDANLTVINIDNPDERLLITTPMASAALKGAHDIQNLGAVQTYLRRYLWVTLMEIVEHDALDATMDGKPVEKPVKPAEKPVEKPIPKKIEGKAGPWQIVVEGAGQEPEWLDHVMTVSQTALDMATSEADVMAIFKQNKELFDLVKAADPAVWKSLMSLFSDTKKKFTKE